MDNKKLLGQRIKELRKAKKITQERLAELVKVEPTTISNMECGRNYPNLATLEKVLEVLGSNFLEVFDFQHANEKSILTKQIKQYIDNAAPKEVEFIYKTMVNLNQFVSK